MSTFNRIRRWKSLGASFIILPPILFFIGAAIWSTFTYSGICPGIMDIPPYPCTIWEFIGRNTVSPFAFAAHLGICITWVGFALLVLFFIFGLRWLIVQFRSDA